MQIKFGTDGWRAIIAREYTEDNVKRVAEGTALWVKEKGGSQIVIGYDCRFGGKMFAEATASVLGKHGIKTLISPDYVSTPMVSLAAVRTGSKLGVVITASHNPPSYNGYKLKSELGGPTIPSEVSEVEALIPDTVPTGLPSIDDLKANGLLEYLDMEKMYVDHVEASFDMELINSSGVRIAYDAMYGAGQSAARKIFKDAAFLHCENNPSFMGQAPEPIHRNLTELSNVMKSDDSLSMGLANDGDADRIGLYDEDGKFVDSHHILLLLLHYLKKYKQLDGKVIVTFSVGHIPERDGIWIGLVILEFMAKTGKSLKQLIQEVYDIVGSFHCDRNDLHISNEVKRAVIEKCKANAYKSFGLYQVQKVENIDGFKFWLSDTQWVMIRPSGTEPVLRVYAQDATESGTKAILDTVCKAILE